MESSSINIYIYIYTHLLKRLKDALEHRKTFCRELAESRWLLGSSSVIAIFILSHHILSNMHSQCRNEENLNVQKNMLPTVKALLQFLGHSVLFSQLQLWGWRNCQWVSALIFKNCLQLF